ncbi:MAG TPA: hypothetical protein DCZ10_09550 [Pelotomaculum sp.]|nr:hypothetical protein [Pelotomaculum sp.]
MAIVLPDEVVRLLSEKETVKVLATTDEKGTPHAAVKQTLHLETDGNLVYLELLESSQTNKNMVRSIWFNRKIAVTLKGKDGLSYQIKGRPVKAVITGPVFQKHYVDIRERLGDVDLAAVWIIEPEEVFNQTYPERKVLEESTRLYFKHLDRLAKPSI